MTMPTVGGEASAVKSAYSAKLANQSALSWLDEIAFNLDRAASLEQFLSESSSEVEYTLVVHHPKRMLDWAGRISLSDSVTKHCNAITVTPPNSVASSKDFIRLKDRCLLGCHWLDHGRALPIGSALSGREPDCVTALTFDVDHCYRRHFRDVLVDRLGLIWTGTSWPRKASYHHTVFVEAMAVEEVVPIYRRVAEIGGRYLDQHDKPVPIVGGGAKLLCYLPARLPGKPQPRRWGIAGARSTRADWYHALGIRTTKRSKPASVTVKPVVVKPVTVKPVVVKCKRDHHRLIELDRLHVRKSCMMVNMTVPDDLTYKRGSVTTFRIRCCLPGHRDEHPSGMVTVGDGLTHFKCFSHVPALPPLTLGVLHWYLHFRRGGGKLVMPTAKQMLMWGARLLFDGRAVVPDLPWSLSIERAVDWVKSQDVEFIPAGSRRAAMFGFVHHGRRVVLTVNSFRAGYAGANLCFAANHLIHGEYPTALAAPFMSAWSRMGRDGVAFAKVRDLMVHVGMVEVAGGTRRSQRAPIIRDGAVEARDPERHVTNIYSPIHLG